MIRMLWGTKLNSIQKSKTITSLTGYSMKQSSQGMKLGLFD